MSVDMSFKGTLVFASAKALKAALKELRDDEDGCLESSAVQPDDLRVEGTKVHVDLDMSAPASFFDGTCHVLETLAGAAESGEIEAIYDSGEGPDAVFTERITAGEEADEEPASG
jgi:hypothetical protein